MDASVSPRANERGGASRPTENGDLRGRADGGVGRPAPNIGPRRPENGDLRVGLTAGSGDPGVEPGRPSVARAAGSGDPRRTRRPFGRADGGVGRPGLPNTETFGRGDGGGRETRGRTGGVGRPAEHGDLRSRRWRGRETGRRTRRPSVGATAGSETRAEHAHQRRTRFPPDSRIASLTILPGAKLWELLSLFARGLYP